jgi:nitrite reductase/ring-hydroxylating ferredoxin subunit
MVSRQRLASKSDIPEGKAIIVVTDDGLEIALFKWKGEVFAINNICPHEGGPLGESAVEEGQITCPWHGWQFNLKNGDCTNMPGEKAHCFAIQIVHDDIYLA